MTPQQYELVQATFLRLREANEADRAQELAALEDSMRREVLSLLNADEECESFLTPPVNPAISTDDDRTPQSQPLGLPVASVGPYRLLQQLGEGGFGAVFMAEQTEPVYRKVALKLIKPGMDSKQVLARFQAERQALAMMEHASIARFFDVGTTESGSPFFVMELVRGEPIDQFCDQNDLSLESRLKLFLQVCHAVHHAHRKGIIHRDIKPTNVLVGLGEGEPVAKVIDFGIAKALDARLTDATLFTEFGQIVGTLEYMSPEQAQMSVVDIDTRSDVYSLGVLLYRLLTGSTPIGKEELLKDGPFEIPRVIRETEPVRPSTRVTQQQKHTNSASGVGVSSLTQGDLDWITIKCLAKDRRERYDSANDLAKDISLFLEGLPVSAHPPAVAYRLRKFVRRHRMAAAVTLVIVGSILLGLAGLLVGFRAAISARDEAQETATRLAESMYSSLIDSAWDAAAQKNFTRADELLAKCLPEMRGWEWEFVRARADDSNNSLLREAGSSGVRAIEVSKDEAFMACLLANGDLEVRDRYSQQVVHKLDLPTEITATTFSAEALAVGTSKGAIHWFDIHTWQQRGQEQTSSGGVYDITIDTSEERYAICTGAGWVGLFDAVTHELRREWKLPSRCSEITFSRGDALLVGAGLDGCLYRLNETGAVESEQLSRSSLNCLVQPVSNRICVLTRGRALSVDTKNNRTDELLKKPLATSFDFAAGIAIIGCGDGTVFTIDERGKETRIAELGAAVMAINASNEQFVVGLADGRIVPLDFPAEDNSAKHVNTVVAKILQRKGLQVSVSDTGHLRGKSIRDERRVDLKIHSPGVWNVAFDTEERLLASVGEDQTIRCRRFPDGGLLVEAAIAWGVRDLCFGSSGEWIASAPNAEQKAAEGTIGIWNIDTGLCEKLLNGHRNWVLKFGLSPDGRFLVSSGEDRTIRIWNTDTWECEHVISPDLRASAEHLCFVGDDIVVGHRDGWITTWNLQTGKARQSWMAFGDALSGLSATEDGRILSTCRSSDKLKVFDPAGESLATLELGVGQVRHLVGSTDGRIVVYVGNDATSTLVELPN